MSRLFGCIHPDGRGRETISMPRGMALVAVLWLLVLLTVLVSVLA